MDKPTNWAVGDLALCIKQGAWHYVKDHQPVKHPAPKPGGIYTVSELAIEGALCLRFPGFVGKYHNSRFIKIEDHEPDEYDLFVIREMKGEPPCQPVIPTPVTVPLPITEESELHPKSSKDGVIRGTMIGDVLPTRWTQFTD